MKQQEALGDSDEGCSTTISKQTVATLAGPGDVDAISWSASYDGSRCRVTRCVLHSCTAKLSLFCVADWKEEGALLSTWCFHSIPLSLWLCEALTLLCWRLKAGKRIVVDLAQGRFEKGTSCD